MDTLVVERWQRDREEFIQHARSLGAVVLERNAFEDPVQQQKDIQWLIDQKVEVLVIIPNDRASLSDVVRKAKDRGILVISYDRLIQNADIDIYISFDNEKVGSLMAQSIVQAVPVGNVLIINGGSNDFNSYMINRGMKEVLRPFLSSGTLKVIDEIWPPEWRNEESRAAVEKVLAEGIVPDGIIAANDFLAASVISALSAKRLAGKVFVTGQDAELAACQRIVEGTQLMTVYKPIKDLAKTAAETAVYVGSGEELRFSQTIFNELKDVPYIALDPILVTRENLESTVIADGFHSYEDVFRETLD
jgi:D-xylose transport system substrate-binding protein